MLTTLRKITIAGVAAVTLAGTMAASTDTAQAFYGHGGLRGGYGFHGGFGRFGYGRFGYGSFGYRRFGYGRFGPYGYGFRRFGYGFGYPGFYGYGFRRTFFGPGFYGPFGYGYGGFHGPRRFF